MEWNEIGIISFGKIKFTFFINNDLLNYLNRKNYKLFELIPKGSFFYHGIIEKLKPDLKSKKNIKIYLISLTGSDFSLDIKNNKKNLTTFPDYPIHLGNILHLVKFGVSIK